MNLRPCKGYVTSSECTYCFLNEYAAQGLYICMHCDFCACREHVGLHNEKCRHSLFLLKRYVLKPKGKHIEANDKARMLLDHDSSSVAELESFVCRWPDLTPVHNPAPEIQVCARYLQEAEENPDMVLFRKKSAGTVYQGFTRDGTDQACTCEHVIEVLTSALHTNRAAESPGAKRCSMCDLSSNLWICLYCGHVGCGIFQYGGEDGRGHAEQHYKMHSKEDTPCKHCVAVKLTSMSSTACEAYCYACDYFVSYTFQQAHIREMLGARLMEFIGDYAIDLLTRKQGDTKTLEARSTELAEKISSYGLDKTATDRTIYPMGIISGMRNIGNTCYANSVMACLRACGLDPLTQRCGGDSAVIKEMARQHYLKCTLQPRMCKMCQLYRFYASGFTIINHDMTEIGGLGYTLNDLPHFIVYSNPHLSQIIRHFAPQFTTDENIGYQHDAHEFLERFLDELMQSIGDIIPTICLPQARKELRCYNCMGHVFSPEPQRAYNLMLTCSLFDSVVDCEVGAEVPLEETLVTEIRGAASAIDGLSCPLCSTKNVDSGAPMVMLSTSYFVKATHDLPDILVVAVNRQFYNSQTMAPCKLLTRIDKADSIDIKRLIATRVEGQDESINVTTWLNAKRNAAQMGPDMPGDETPISDEAIQQMLDCGIVDTDACTAMLRHYHGDVERAINAIFDGEVPPSTKTKQGAIESRLDELNRMLEADQAMNEEAIPERDCDAIDSRYALAAFVQHTGSDINSGHYIAYIRVKALRRDDLNRIAREVPMVVDTDWVAINDDDVSIISDPPIAMGYIYFYKRASQVA